MEIPLFQVDAFTDRPFSGNPAAVCILDEDRDDRWMQAVAAEMNLSETAFLREEGTFAKVCCRVNSEAELTEIHDKALAAGWKSISSPTAARRSSTATQL